MSFEDINKLIKQFEEGPNIIPSGSYSLSKKDIKQDEILDIRNDNPNLKDNTNSIPTNFDLNTFTEFEDENGNILLIKYSTVEYEYRGNKYCKYILINEDTNYKEDGIAQIKDGQKIHIKDQKRVEKISKYMSSKKTEAIEWLRSRDSITIAYTIDEGTINIDYDVICVGYMEVGVYFDTLAKVFYQDKSENRIYEYLYHYAQYLDEFSENAIPTVYKLSDSDDIEYINKLTKDKHFHKISSIKFNEIKSDSNITNNEITVKQNTSQKWLIILLSIPLFVALLYPIVEFILWICSHVLPLFWHDKFSSKAITDFAVQNLPYAFHPNFGWIKHFSINLLSLAVFGLALISIFETSYEDQGDKFVQKSPLPFGILATIFAAVFIYAMYTPTFFDKISTIAAWIVVPTILVGLFCR